MRAIVYYEYGAPAVLRLKEVETPSLGDDGVMVSVRGASTNPYDWHFIRGQPYFMRLFSGLRKPKAKHLGLDFAGRVEAVGKDVTEFSPGDEVYGMCDGAFAEYVCASRKRIALKPTNLSFPEAASVPLAALTALQGLRDAGRVRAGQKVLIVGAGGGAGTFAVQIAKLLGAEVTAVCSSSKHELVRSLGADHTIDYQREDFAEGGRKYDVIFQLAGTASPSHCRRALTRKGRLVLSSGDSDGRWIGPLDRILKAIVLSPFVSQALVTLSTKCTKGDLEHMTELIEAGKVTPIIDRAYSLEEVPEAIRYLERGHARGKVVITV